MINSRIAKATLAIVIAIAMFSGCSFNSKEPDGSALAAQSCTTDLLAVSAGASSIVDTGLISLKKMLLDEVTARAETSQNRAILSAKAAATNKYWQPLADAWALDEALARSALLSMLSDKIPDESGMLQVDTSTYDKFVSNVNIDFAAVTKDTYCRIAFVKQNLDIKYDK